MENLEDTPWVKDGEEKPNVEVVEDGSEIWSELGIYVKNSLRSPRKKRRKVKTKFSNRKMRKYKRR